MAAPAAAPAAAGAAAAGPVDSLFPAGGGIIQRRSVPALSIHLILQHLSAPDCLRLASTCRRLRVDVAAGGTINNGFWHRGRGRGLPALNSTVAHAARVIDGAAVPQPLPAGPLQNATSLSRHVEIGLVLTRRNGLPLPGQVDGVQLRLQENHVGVTRGDILHMRGLRGLDLRQIQQLSSVVDLLQDLQHQPLAGQRGPRLERLLLPWAPPNVNGLYPAVRRLPHLRELTCTDARFHYAAALPPSPITQLHAIRTDAESLYNLRCLNVVSMRLDQPRRLPRLFGIGVHAHAATDVFHHLTELHLGDFDADALFPGYEHGGPPLPAPHYWGLIWPSLPRLSQLTLQRVRHIDTLLDALLPLPAAAPVPCPHLRSLTIDAADPPPFQPSAAMIQSFPARTTNPARPQHVHIVYAIIID